MLYVLARVAVVVSVDILFFRHHFMERLIANIGIVLVFAAFGFLIFWILRTRSGVNCFISICLEAAVARRVAPKCELPENRLARSDTLRILE